MMSLLTPQVYPVDLKKTTTRNLQRWSSSHFETKTTFLNFLPKLSVKLFPKSNTRAHIQERRTTLPVKMAKFHPESEVLLSCPDSPHRVSKPSGAHCDTHQPHKDSPLICLVPSRGWVHRQTQRHRGPPRPARPCPVSYPLHTQSGLRRRVTQDCYPAQDSQNPAPRKHILTSGKTCQASQSYASLSPPSWNPSSRHTQTRLALGFPQRHTTRPAVLTMLHLYAQLYT